MWVRSRDMKEVVDFSEWKHLDICMLLATGNADPSLNAKLASVLVRAKAAGLPKDNIETALKKVECHHHHPLIVYMQLIQDINLGNVQRKRFGRGCGL